MIQGLNDRLSRVPGSIVKRWGFNLTPGSLSPRFAIPNLGNAVHWAVDCQYYLSNFETAWTSAVRKNSKIASRFPAGAVCRSEGRAAVADVDPIPGKATSAGGQDSPGRAGARGSAGKPRIVDSESCCSDTPRQASILPFPGSPHLGSRGQNGVGRMEFIAGFRWPLPRAFAGAVLACRFEQGDVIYSDAGGYRAWSKRRGGSKFAVQVLDPPKSARALAPGSEGKRTGTRRWRSN